MSLVFAPQELLGLKRAEFDERWRLLDKDQQDSWWLWFEEEERTKWRETPATMSIHLEPGSWKPWKYWLLLGEKFRNAVTGVSPRQIWALPPRLGKSVMASQWGPAWALDRNPTTKIILASYGDDLADENARACRDLLSTHAELLRTQLRRDVQRRDRFMTEQGGGVLGAGIRSGITGFGAHGIVCFPGDTLVATPLGMREIRELARHGGKVWACVRGSIVERSITAGRVSPASEFVEITTTAGRSFRCTAEHPVWIEGRGYIPARLVQVGAQVRTMGRAGLPHLCQSVQATGLRPREVAGSGREDLLLRSHLPRAGTTSAAAVQEVWWSHWSAAQPQPPPLLRTLSSGPSTRTSPNPDVSGVPNERPRQNQPAGLLLEAMRGQGSLSPHDWAGKLALQERVELHVPVHEDAPADPRTRWSGVHRLRSDHRTDRCASLQRGASGQSARELGDSLQSMPHDPPQVSGDTVDLVRRLRDESVPVYDLSVEEASNFFAEGVLVHNCDDPFKNWQEAHSQATRDAIDMAYRAVILSRLESDDAWQLVVMTRWHEDDLSGRLIERMEDGTGQSWELVRIPAIAERYDPKSADRWLRVPDLLGRQEGEVIEPERFSLAFEKQRAIGLGTFLTAALLQQRPAPDEGGEFKRSWWNLLEVMPEVYDQELSSWDMKLKERDSGDYTVGQVWGRLGRACYLRDTFRGKWTQATTANCIALITVRYPSVRRHLVENAGYGPEVMEALRTPSPGYEVSDEMAAELGMTQEEREAVARIRRRGLSGLIPVTPKGSKTVRARAIVPYVEAGDCFLPVHAPWLQAFLEELSSFDQGSYDDQVDAFSQALAKMHNLGIRRTRTYGEEMRSTTAKAGLM